MLSGFDERGQAIQVGAVLLFGILIVAFAGYQAFVVPDQNRQIEFNHNQEVQQDLQNLRNGIVSIPGGTDGRSVAVPLGVQYPSRIVAVNPGPATGSIRTTGTANDDVNATILNATADGETGDFWDGRDQVYTTGGIVYRPNYNEYRQAPQTVYDSTVLFNQFGGRNLSITGQRLVDGDRINLVTLNGSLSVARTGAASVDLRAVSSSTRTITVENASNGENVTVAVATQLNESVWRDLLATEMVGEEGGHVYNVTSEPIDGSQFHELSIRLEADVEYTLRVTRVGVGTGIQDTDEAYLTTVSGNGSAVPEGSTQKLVVEVRDGLNNPVSGVEVNASTNLSTVSPSSDTTDADGQIAFTYEAPSDIDGGPKSVAVNLSTAVDPATRSSFDAETVENASFSLTVRNTDGSGTGSGGGGGANVYTIAWESPSGDNPGAALSNCDSDSCDWDVGNSGDSTLTLRGRTDPSVDGITLDFGVNDSSIGTISPGEGTTDSSGAATTELSAVNEGTVRAIVASGGSSDDINITLSNIEAGLRYGNDAVAKDGPDADGVAGGVEFTAANTFDQGVEIESIQVGSPTGQKTVLQDSATPNDQPQRTEVYIAGDTVDGWNDLNGETGLPNTFDLDSDGFSNNNDNPESPSGGSFTFYLYEFEYDNGPMNGERVSMAGESFDVTVTYRLTGSGATNSTTFTVSP